LCTKRRLKNGEEKICFGQKEGVYPKVLGGHGDYATRGKNWEERKGYPQVPLSGDRAINASRGLGGLIFCVREETGSGVISPSLHPQQQKSSGGQKGGLCRRLFRSQHGKKRKTALSLRKNGG